jgi:hypothetical protein
VTEPTPAAPSRLRRVAPWLWVAAILVALGVVSSSSGQGSALDPNGTGPTGAKAFVLLLRQYGAQVTIDQGVPGPGVGAAIVLSDQLDQARRAALGAWVRAGGFLVVADPTSQLQVGAATQVGNGLTVHDLQPSGDCALPGLANIQQLSVGPSLLLRVPRGEAATACYGYDTSSGDHAFFLVAVHAGSGAVVGLGGAGLWTNARLDQLDNAVLAVDLLAPAGGGHVDVLVSAPGSGRQGVFDLLSPRLKWALLELVVAFAVLVAWRGRRFGRPITESGPVQLAGSEIVSATGELMARSGNRDAAARQLRDAATARLGTALGLGPRARADVVADALAARSGIPAARTRALLDPVPLADDADLVRLAGALAALDREVTRGRTPTHV